MKDQNYLEKLNDVEEHLESLWECTAKAATALDAHPYLDYESRHFDSIETEMSDQDAHEQLYPYLCVSTAFLTYHQNQYYDKLDSFHEEYEEKSENLPPKEKKKISNRQEKMRDTMNELRPIIKDINQEIQHFDLEIYTKNPSMQPLTKAP